MNRASRSAGAWLARAVVAVGVATASLSQAYANKELPPAKYDVGGMIEDEVMDNAHQFGLFPSVRRVKYGEAFAACDELMQTRYQLNYPASDDGNVLLGCMIRDADGSRPAIIYSKSPYTPAAQMLRHEFGHLLGWPEDHRRD